MGATVRFRVKVTASYSPTDSAESLTGHRVAVQPREWSKQLGDWVSEAPAPGEERSVTDDATIDPQRLTLTVVYSDIEAPSEWDARVDATFRFREAISVADLPEPETVVADVDEPGPN